jgi:DNA-binding response OmpR family regulator
MSDDKEHPSAGSARPLILIVDDDRVVHSIFARALASFPGTIIHAHDGQQALAIAREAKPDLLIIDALLPNLDGRVVAKTLKMEPATSTMRVAIMTALYKGARYRNEALVDFLADVYLEKPVSPDKLWEVIERTLHIARPSPASPSTSIHAMRGPIEATQERGAL